MLDEARLSEAVAVAQRAFWRVVAEQYPAVATGDMPWDAEAALQAAMEAAVRTWLEANAPEAAC